MKIAIVGAGIAESELLSKSADYKLWSVNNLFRQFPNVLFDKWFELHQFQYNKGNFLRRGRGSFGRNPDINSYLRDLNDLNIPVMMYKPLKRIKKGQQFPFKELMRRFQSSYFGCSFAWMVAYAIDLGASEIAFFGVALNGNEYYYQRPSTEYYIGIAKGMGIKITIDSSSKLLQESYIYAYKEDFGLIYTLHGELTKELIDIMLTTIQQRIDNIWQDAKEDAHGTLLR